MRNRLLIGVGWAVCTAVGLAQSPSGETSWRVNRKFLYPREFAAGKPYTPGVLVGETLYISGQIDKDPQTGAQPKGMAEQTRMAMNNVGHVLRAAGLDFGNVVSCHVQLIDMSQFKEMNEVYGSFFGPDHYPARTTLAFPGLPGGANIEVTCIAYADKAKISIVTPPPGTIPAALGPYRPAVLAGDTLYISGSGGRKPQTNELDSTTDGQTKQTMANIGQILSAAGLEHKDAVFANVYFLDPDGLTGATYGKLNSVYKDSFALGSAPSRASFCVSKLPGPIGVEITLIATRDRKNKGRVIPASAALSPTSSNGGLLDKDTLYTSAKSGAGTTLAAQMRDSIESIRDILKLAGMNLANVVDAHVYLKDLGQMDAMNAIFREYFPDNPPARTTVQVIQDQFVQVQVVAVR